jgi:hypothetical protein
MSNPFTNKILCDWFFDSIEENEIGISEIVTFGSGPFEESEFDEFLSQKGLSVFEFNNETAVIVVGANEWDEEQIDRVIQQRAGKTLKIYSQEMFLAFLYSGRDPYSSGEIILEKFTTNHPVFEYLKGRWFSWPTTIVEIGDRVAQIKPDWPEKGVLKILGYKVGNSGLPVLERYKILRRAFTGELPAGLSESYLIQWGSPSSSKRLKKMAESIAAFCRNAKRKNYHDVEKTISDWENDLEWLKDTFYKPMRFSFLWPETK